MESTELTSLVLAREKLEKNLFWKLLVDKINEQRYIISEMLVSEISAPIDKIRYYQGQLAMCQIFRDLPDLILSDLSEEKDET